MRYLLVTLIVLMAASASVEAIVLGQVDNFQDGTLSGWSSGGAHLSNIETGGSTGPGDRYLQVSTLISSPNAELSAMNRGWGGDYVVAGVNLIEVGLLNPNTFPLEIRIVVSSMDYGVYTSSIAYMLPPDGQWHHTAFSLLDQDLTWIGGSAGYYDMAMQNILSLRIRHQPGPPAFDVTPIVAAFGIDNIRATPEPGMLMMFSLLFLAAGKRQRTSRHSAR